MKAVMCEEYGPVETLRFKEVDDLVVGEGQLLIDVKAAGCNFPDALVIQGKYQIKVPPPFAPGGEGSGVVSAIGENVSGYAVGDRVLFYSLTGAFAEQIVIPAANAVIIPDEMPYTTAAGFLAAYGTGYHSLKQRAGLQPGEHVLILGASGGLGSSAIQIAKAMGARVIACASSASKLAACGELGADWLIDYTSEKGDKLQAALHLPANYEEGKSYPTIVYIYEKLSQGKNSYAQPYFNGFNKSVYTSNGYAVLMPDIVYTINDPGMSAVWCVLPALEAAIATGVVDADRVGLHGHSWGGYQTSFLVTQTQAFAAAVAGAPLTNMISMYSSIYWNSGSGNMSIFESSQGRFTGGYWEAMDAYVRNSPVFFAENVRTPLIILHNDADGAVDWNQGIEYYSTLRRLGKDVIMLQYEGENHGLRKPANMKDYTVRMREFFDHHLRGAEAPEWLLEGVDHLDMEDHLKDRAKLVKPDEGKGEKEIKPKKPGGGV